MQPLGISRKVFPLENLDKFIDKDNDYLFVAILWNRLNADRRHMYERVKSMGYKLANIVSPHARIRGELQGNNCWICDDVIVQEHVKLGSNIFIMDNALVGHRSVIDNHSFIGIKAAVCGAVLIGEQCYIGVHSTIFDSVRIGKKCLIGGA